MPLTDEELAKEGLIQPPTVIGGMVPVVNIAGITPGPIKLTGALLGDIFLGKITKWNDAALTALNPGVPLPAADIAVVRRADGSGTSFIFTNYLALDLTERMRSNAMRRDFVANVSHKIRTPLTVLASFVETMASLPLTEVERARVIALMAQQTDRMQLLVSDLLSLAQLEGSPRPPTDR